MMERPSLLDFAFRLHFASQYLLPFELKLGLQDTHERFSVWHLLETLEKGKGL